MDIREKTGLIIRRGNEYLVGTILYSTDLRWSISPWEAWYTRQMALARMVRDRVDGEIMLFNPVAKQLRKLEDGHAGTEKVDYPLRGQNGGCVSVSDLSVRRAAGV